MNGLVALNDEAQESEIICNQQALFASTCGFGRGGNPLTVAQDGLEFARPKTDETCHRQLELPAKARGLADVRHLAARRRLQDDAGDGKLNP